MDSLMQLPSWMVVMHVIVIQADFATGASSGLFGLLSDAPVQLVDVSDEAIVRNNFDMADKCEPWGLVTIRQDLHYISGESYRQILRDIIINKFYSDVLLCRLYPVIMFGLCTDMCNHIGLGGKRKKHRPYTIRLRWTVISLFCCRKIRMDSLIKCALFIYLDF
jgi:hypothetical protein